MRKFELQLTRFDIFSNTADPVNDYDEVAPSVKKLENNLDTFSEIHIEFI